MNEIRLGNCISLFQDIEDESIDMVFADPPFNLNKKYNKWDDAIDGKLYLEWCEKWVSEIIRVTKPTGSIFVHNIPKWLICYTSFFDKCIFKHWISWDAPSGPMGSSLQPSHYGILFYAKTNQNKFFEIRHPHKRCRHSGRLLKDYGGKKDMIHWFGPLVSDVWTDIHRVKHNKYRSKHPCQLPLHLLERIILMSTDEGDKVLDPFMGTGTTALAAKRLGRQYLGFEIDTEYKKDAEDKLKQETFESKIDKFWVSYFGYTGLVTIRDEDCDDLLTAEYFDMPTERKLLDKSCITLKKEVSLKFK